MTNHTITLYPTLVKRLVARGWTSVRPRGIRMFYKWRGNYTYVVQLNHATNRATFTRYERIASTGA